MKTKNLMLFTLLGALTLGWALHGTGNAAQKGRALMEKSDALPEPKTRKTESAMVIIKSKNKEVKTFSMIGKKYGQKSRARTTFTKPTRLEFLNWSAPGEDSQQWIKLSSGSVRKIASSDKGGAFVGSHFYYEDMSDRDIDDYNYRYLGDKKIKGVDCYMVESIKKSASKVYVKSIIYLRKSDYFMIRADLYEKSGHTKTLVVEKIEKINGILTPRKVTMKRTDGKGKTIIYLRSVKYNVPVSDALLKKESL